MATSSIFRQSIPYKLSSNKISFVPQIPNNEILSTISKEVTKSKYSTVSSWKMNKFPYFLIGKIVSQCSHSQSSTKNFINGVGILIGPRIVLTVAHNLCHIYKNEVIFSKSVCFYPAANGDFVPFTTFKSKEYFIPPGYINATLKGDKQQQLSNDWGVVLFDKNIGDEILTLFDICTKDNSNLKTNEILYSFFTNEDNKNKLKNNSNIALVGYTEQRGMYRNSNAFQLNSFSKNDTCSTNIDDNNLTNITTSHASSLGTQGKLTSEILNEGRDLFRTSITSANNVNLSIESFPLSSPHYQKENSVDFLILHDQDGIFLDYEGEYTEYDKVVMSESIGELSTSEMTDDNIAYKISTYKGQSGSPVFIFSSETNEYTFIGLHSRRGPCKYDDKDLSLLSFSSSICDFNKGIGIYGVRKKRIISIITEVFSKKKTKMIEDISINYQSYIFKMVSLSYGGEIKVMGLFRVDVLLSLIFGFAGKLLLIPDEFILLSSSNYDNEKNILNYNYDRDKSLIDIFGDNFNNKIIFEVCINIKKYGEYLAQKILKNFLFKNKLTEKELAENFNEHTKEFFSNIFEEISFLNNNIIDYGLLFKKIRKNIFFQLKL